MWPSGGDGQWLLDLLFVGDGSQQAGTDGLLRAAAAADLPIVVLFSEHGADQAHHALVVIRLVGAVLLETHDEWQTADRADFSEESMAQVADLSDDGPAREVPHDDQHERPAS